MTLTVQARREHAVDGAKVKNWRRAPENTIWQSLELARSGKQTDDRGLSLLRDGNAE